MSQIPTTGSIPACTLTFHVPIISQLIKSGPATYFLLNILECIEPFTAQILWLQIKNLFPQVIYTIYTLHFRTEWYVWSSKNRCHTTLPSIKFVYSHINLNSL